MDGKLSTSTMRREGETLDEFLLREKRREELICALTGWVCIRITWEDLARPRILARRISELLAVPSPQTGLSAVDFWRRSCRFWRRCNDAKRPGYPLDRVSRPPTPYDTGRFSYGVERTMVVRELDVGGGRGCGRGGPRGRWGWRLVP